MESVGMTIRRHARSNKEWQGRDKVDYAYTLYEQINENLFNNSLPDLVIGYDKNIQLKAGNYYHEGDSIGVKYHFDMNPNLDNFSTFLAVMHNCVHAQTEVYKKKGEWYHSSVFRKNMEDWGINPDKNGEVSSLNPEILENTLEKIGRPELIPYILDYDCHAPIPEPEPEPNAPKKKKQASRWHCQCPKPTYVRCSTELNAMCTECDRYFVKSITATLGEPQNA